MQRSMVHLIRRAATVFAAGMLFQTGGCALDVPTLASGLATSIANSYISSVIFGLFNVGTGF